MVKYRPRPKAKSKYKNKKTKRGAITFDSIKEAKRYDVLCLMQKAGHVKFFLRQVPFDLPGGVKYRLDFLIHWEDGSVTYEDVKGMRTAMYILKKKQVEDLYPITITES